MTKSYARVSVMDMAKRMTIQVKIRRIKEFKMRLRIASKLFWLASKICGMQYEQDIELSQGNN